MLARCVGLKERLVSVAWRSLSPEERVGILERGKWPGLMVLASILLA